MLSVRHQGTRRQKEKTEIYSLSKAVSRKVLTS